jgi:hypothetical protein
MHFMTDRSPTLLFNFQTQNLARAAMPASSKRRASPVTKPAPPPKNSNPNRELDPRSLREAAFVLLAPPQFSAITPLACSKH